MIRPMYTVKGIVLFMRGLWYLSPWVTDEQFDQWEREAWEYRSQQRESQ